MNSKAEYMINRLFIAALLFCLLPAATAFGQELRKEALKGTDGLQAADYAVFYSNGMPESAIWPLGMKLMAKDADGTYGSTIRHTESKGNGENIAVNDKVPYRFIIAPKDGGDGSTVTWAAAMGLNTSANNDLAADGSVVGTGCDGYFTDEFKDGWRLPTQREMMLMWLFREGINTVYSQNQLTADQYWTATENAEAQAWYLDFSTAAPQSENGAKNTSKKYRCVRDY